MPNRPRRKRTKRCHGNRKLQRFRKKCRRRDNRNVADTATRQTRRDDVTSKKRKRLATSASSRSISQRLPKRPKNRTMDPIVIEEKQEYLPKYLTKKPRLLFQMLRLHLNHSLKNKQQQEFIYRRLSLVDRQYRLDSHRHLWQSYCELGANHEIWPEHVYKKAKTKEHLSCLQFVKQHRIKLNQQYEQCTKDLMEQIHLCPSTLKSLLEMDDNEKLKQFVQIQQKYWSFRMQSHLNRYQSIIQETNLFNNLSFDSLNENERERINRLLTLKDQQWQIFQIMSKLELRVSIQFLPNDFDQLETFVAPDFYRPLIRNSIAMEFKQKDCKILQEVKRKWLMLKFEYYEKQYEHYHRQYQNYLQEFESYCSTRLYTIGSQTLYHLFLAYIKHHSERLQQEFFYEKLRFYRKKLQRLHRQRSKKEKKMISVSPTVLFDIHRHPFTANEMSYLSRGPNYIRPNQSSLQSKKKRIHYVNTTVEKYIRILKDYMSYCKDRPVIPSTASIYKSYTDRLQKQLFHYYLNPLPLMDYLRAQRELKWIRSIQRKLRKYRLVLRETDKSSILHISRKKDYVEKAMKYYEETGAYEELTSNPFDFTYTTVVQSLNRLRSLNKIKEFQKEKMLPKRDQVQLAYMYFLPKPHKIGTPVRPIINTLHAATTGISKFLDQLIRPLFDRYVRETTIVDGVDLLHRLHTYVSKGYFTASTLFVTFDITNLYTMLPQEESLKILREFFNEYHCAMIDGISIDTIIDLARLVLQNNTFVFEKKFYRQMIGGAMGSPFTLTLANIFMWKWQKGAILSKLSNKEVYGRYIDDVFFTWNESEAKVKELLEEANRYHINIKLDYQIGPNIPFLDILLTNQHGSLMSSVYHKPSNEPSILSFLSDHPRHVFRNVIQTFLMRAIRYSSTYDLFNREKRIIRLMLLYNSYPTTYINVQFRRFFEKHLPSYSSLFLPSIINEEQFLNLHQKLLVQPSVAPINVTSTACTTTCVPMVSRVIEERQKSPMERTMFVHCTHEARFFGLTRDIHTIHDSLFKDTPNSDIKLIVGHRNNHNLEFELSQKRPRPASILYDPSKKSESRSNQPATSSTS